MSQTVGDPPPWWGFNWPYLEPPSPPVLHWPAPPRVMPVMMPMPQWPGSVTIAILDEKGGTVITTDQARPDSDQRQPISTAPRDGTTIMLFFPPPGIGHWAEGSWAGDQWEAYGPTTGFAGHPSHWLPAIPEPER